MGKLYIQQWKFKRHVKLWLTQKIYLQKFFSMSVNCCDINTANLCPKPPTLWKSVSHHILAKMNGLFRATCIFLGKERASSLKRSPLNLAYLIFGIGCVHYTSSLFSSINDNTYYRTCKNTKVVLTEIL